MQREPQAESVLIPCAGADLPADLTVPAAVRGLVVFAHGSGSGRCSPRNRAVAAVLQRAALATLLPDLLPPAAVLTSRPAGLLRLSGLNLLACLKWIDTQPALAALPLGLFGASTGAAVALEVAAAARLRAPHALLVVEAAGHLFAEPGALDAVALATRSWFERQLCSR